MCLFFSLLNPGSPFPPPPFSRVERAISIVVRKVLQDIPPSTDPPPPDKSFLSRSNQNPTLFVFQFSCWYDIVADVYRFPAMQSPQPEATAPSQQLAPPKFAPLVLHCCKIVRLIYFFPPSVFFEIPIFPLHLVAKCCFEVLVTIDFFSPSETRAPSHLQSKHFP